MTLSLITSLAFVTTAQANADLATTLSVPAGTVVYDDTTVQVTVENIGRKTADGVALVIDLPETHTSPTVHVMGELSAVDSRCALAGTSLECDLGRLTRGASTTVSFDIALPWSAEPLEFEATASTRSRERALGNNADADAASQVYIDAPLSGPHDMEMWHCTGTDLISFYECTLYPSSLSSHFVTFEADGSITFPPFLPPGYSGRWEQDSDDHLWFEYTFDSVVVAVFEGNGVSGSCFEGVTEFPYSSYDMVSGYEVCVK
ncbi:MAG: hypothetical protein H6742_11705 [Alphaproteobacteria bacterium]|nr:hypothetical protein [Alphaproteobacteria bacterium]